MIALLLPLMLQASPPTWIVTRFNEREQPRRTVTECAACAGGEATITWIFGGGRPPFHVVAVTWRGKPVPAARWSAINAPDAGHIPDGASFLQCWNRPEDKIDAVSLTIHRRNSRTLATDDAYYFLSDEGLTTKLPQR